MNPRNLAVATTVDGMYWPDAVALAETEALTPEDMAPYRELLTEYLRERGLGEDATVEAVLSDPRDWNVTVPQFFHWLAATHPDRLTDPSPSGDTLPEGDPMTDTLTFDLALVSGENTAAASDYVMHHAWPAGALEPFRNRLIQAALAGPDYEPGDRVGAETRVANIITSPRAWFVTVPGYFRWLREHDSLPELQLSPEGDVEPVVFHAGDRVRYTDDERNVGVAGDERIVSEVHSNTVTLVHTGDDRRHGAGVHANAMVHFERVELVSCPHVQQQPEPGLPAPGGSTFHLGDRVRLTLFSGEQEATVTTSGSYNPSPTRSSGPVVWTDLHNTPSWIRAEDVTLISCPHAEGTTPTTNRVTERLDDGGYVFEGLPVPWQILTLGYHADLVTIRNFVTEVAALPGFTMRTHQADVSRWARGGSNAASQRGVAAWIAEPVRIDTEYEEEDFRQVAGFLHEWAEHQPAATSQPVPQGGQSEPVVIPWGPTHPEWAGWWERARSTAERFGYGSHYDILAERMGGPSRTRYETVEVTVRFQVEEGVGVTHGAVLAGLDANGFTVTSRVPR